MSSLAWKAVQSKFLFDGSWRDIYVLGTDVAGWQRMLDGLRSADYDPRYFRDNNPTELPARAEDAFPNEREYCPLLSVQFCGILANCHFFSFEEIEFDVDPWEVSGQAQLDALLEFMRCLAAARWSRRHPLPSELAQERHHSGHPRRSLRASRGQWVTSLAV